MFHQYLGSAIWRTEEEVHLRRASTALEKSKQEHQEENQEKLKPGHSGRCTK